MMSTRPLKKPDIKRILVFSQTNIGDVVTTCPVIDILKRDFPQARMDVAVGPKAVSLFEDNPHFTVKVFDKRAPLKEKIAWFAALSQAHYDCVVDLRRTMLPVFLRPKYATPVMGRLSSGMQKKDMHLDRLRRLYSFDGVAAEKYAVVNIKEDERLFDREVSPFLQGRDFIVIAPGAASSNKRWRPEGFAAAAERLSAFYKVVFVGDSQDAPIIENIQGGMKSPSLSLAGKINLRALALVLKNSSWAMVHDSGVMHLACYFNVPVLVLWGPTDIKRYGPWSQKSVVVRRNEKCLRCQKSRSKLEHNCMSFIEVEDVMKAADVLK